MLWCGLMPGKPIVTAKPHLPQQHCPHSAWHARPPESVTSCAKDKNVEMVLWVTPSTRSKTTPPLLLAVRRFSWRELGHRERLSRIWFWTELRGKLSAGKSFVAAARK